MRPVRVDLRQAEAGRDEAGGEGHLPTRDLAGQAVAGKALALSNTRAERGAYDIVPARRAHAAFSAASESRAANRPFGRSGFGSLFHVFPRTLSGFWQVQLSSVCGIGSNSESCPSVSARFLRHDGPDHLGLLRNALTQSQNGPTHLGLCRRASSPSLVCPTCRSLCFRPRLRCCWRLKGRGSTFSTALRLPCPSWRRRVRPSTPRRARWSAEWTASSRWSCRSRGSCAQPKR